MPALRRPLQKSFAPSPQVGVRRAARRPGHARPAPIGAEHEARPLEPVVGPLDGARADGQSHGHRPDGGQLLAWAKGPAQDEPADLARDLLPDRGPAVEGQFGGIAHARRSAINIRTARSTSSGPNPYWAT